MKDHYKDEPFIGTFAYKVYPGLGSLTLNPALERTLTATLIQRTPGRGKWRGILESHAGHRVTAGKSETRWLHKAARLGLKSKLPREASHDWVTLGPP